MEKAYKLEFAGSRMTALTVSSCGVSRTEPLHSFGPAVKPHHMIHYIMSGKGSFTMNGVTHPLSVGNGFLIVPDELVMYQADEQDPWTYVWVGFTGEDVEAVLEDMGLNKEHPVFQSEHADELYKYVEDMMEHNTSGLANELRRDGRLQLFLSTIATGNVVESAEGDKANQYVQQALHFIQANYYNPIKVTDIADYVCINRSYLYTLFMDSCGMSPQSFLSAYRITKASEMLQVTDLPIESISISCGYSDPMVFTKAFRQKKGVSPSAYRKEIRSGSERRNKEHLQEIEAFLRQIEKMEHAGNGVI